MGEFFRVAGFERELLEKVVVLFRAASVVCAGGSVR